MLKNKWSIVTLAVSLLLFNSGFVDKKITLDQSVYFVSSDGNDENPGTKELPWKTLTAINNYPFNPGDSVLFARGSQFEGGCIIRSSGTEEEPIVIMAYGNGDAPSFTNPDFSVLNGNVFQIKGSHVVIDDLFFHDCATVVYDSIGKELWEGVHKLGAVFIALGSNHNIVRNCEMVRVPVAIKVYGQYNLITQNYIHDNNEPMAPHWGPLGVVVCTSNNEISYNRFINLVSPSKAYGHDGGAIEIDDRKYPKRNINIHHNYSIGNQGFIEFVGRCVQEDMVIHHNVCMDYQSFAYWHIKNQIQKMSFSGHILTIKISRYEIIYFIMILPVLNRSIHVGYIREPTICTIVRIILNSQIMQVLPPITGLFLEEGHGSVKEIKSVILCL
jgi:hypothetical protein